MDMEEMEEKRPRFLWIIVVAVVAAALTIFILVQSGRMKSKVARVEPVPSAVDETASGPGESSWATPEAALSEERIPPAETAVEPSGKETPAPKKTAQAVEASTPRRTVPPPSRLQAETRAAQRESGAVPTSEAGRFVVQVGSFKDERIARVQADKMERYGYRAWVESADVPGKGRYYRVRIGGFETTTDAERVAESLSRQLGVSCWVDNR